MLAGSCSFAVSAQDRDSTAVSEEKNWASDTTLSIDEVMVVATRTSQEVVPVQMLSGEKLRSLGTHSIADAIRYFSGVQIKDFGGIGGLKSINVRSLGSQHVGVFYDGVELGNAQNGIVDLGRFSLDNLESVSGLPLQRPEERHPPVRQGLRLRQRRLPPDQEAPLHRRQAQQLELRPQGRLVHDRQPLCSLGT